jgi:excisionase family DNA binding protein
MISYEAELFRMNDRTYTTKEIAALVGVTTRTLYTWLAERHVHEPRRDHRQHRVWTETELHQALLYKNTGLRAGEERQLDLQLSQEPR